MTQKRWEQPSLTEIGIEKTQGGIVPTFSEADVFVHKETSEEIVGEMS